MKLSWLTSCLTQPVIAKSNPASDRQSDGRTDGRNNLLTIIRAVMTALTGVCRAVMFVALFILSDSKRQAPNS